MSYKLGSLFDGSGGFPLAGALCGIEPVWAAEVEPYPIAVTRSRFPNMKHLGSVTDIKGGEIEPVDIITFGSPCQDLSVAGKRAGLKHQDNGDDETTRSGLFMEAVRIIREMREATNGAYPKFALWENVPGAFSSNKGEDFRIVCEELIKIVEPNAVMPQVPKNGWAYADSYCGDGWGLAYRVFDAQYWGVPQRRRRIHLVLDLRGECAGEVLFEREGLRGYFTQGRTPRQGVAPDAEGSSGADDRERVYAFHLTQDPISMEEKTPCLSAGSSSHGQAVLGVALTFEPGAARRLGGYVWEDVAGILRAEAGDNRLACCYILDDQGGQSINVRTDGKSPTLRAEAHGNLPCVVEAAGFKAGNGAKANGIGWQEETTPTLTGAPSGTNQVPSVAITVQNTGRGWWNESPIGQTLRTPCGGDSTKANLAIEYNPGARCFIVRRLTPTECARLQGFADWWGHPDHKNELTDEEYKFWLEVRNTHAAINGRGAKEYSKAQMLKWYNSLHTDSAEYKLWGNGIALPPALYCLQGITDALMKEVADAWLL